MGQHVSRTDFEHTYTDQPHAWRRKEIMKKHPEIKTLFGPDPMLAVWSVVLVTFQIISLFWVYHLTWPQTLILAYLLGGTINHILMIGIHEIGHNLAFGYKYTWANRLIGMIANLPMGVPMSVTFRIYHNDHHRFQGVQGLDPDIPTYLEAQFFCTTLGKAVWVILLPFFYALRPMIVSPKVPTALEIVNLIVQLAFDAIILYFFNFRVLMYLILGTLLGMGLHPMASHFIAEHYMFIKGQETYSYYGWMNKIAFNIGYHNEHHDFPFIPYSRLPKVRAMAPEYYDTLPQHESWVKVIYDFIMDPSIGPYARMVRDRHLKKYTPDMVSPVDDCDSAEKSATVDKDLMLANGSSKPSNGIIQKMINGSCKTGNGIHELNNGSCKIGNGIHELNNGSCITGNGIHELNNGTSKIANGIHEFTNGTGKISNGVHQVSNGLYASNHMKND